MTDLLTAPCLLSLFDLFRLSPQHGQKDRESHIQRFRLCQGLVTRAVIGLGRLVCANRKDD